MKYTEEYWNQRFETYNALEVPEKVKNAIRRVYNAYPKECMPQGLCDPMYIMNIIALEIGFGDGMGNFTV